ncbi:MAG: glutamate 5-kinase, partial [Fimbriimonadaceae bacterium]|nr:glutamate 5-kinase [Alphaproteobacteria bacterium]
MTRDLGDFNRIVVKIGSALLVDSKTGTLREKWLQALAQDIASLSGTGADILIVSSGAIALGRGVIGLGRGKLRLEESQAAAAAGQISLSHAWKECLEAQNIITAQVLLTLGDTEERRRYLNARNTIGTLLKLRVVPIINENDTVATSEIRYGDNDRLAARVASMMSADLLILLSDVDGLYSEDPRKGNGSFIPRVERISTEIEAAAGETGSELSRGGMKTKIDAGKIAVAAGAHMIITNGHHMHPLQHFRDTGRGTWFIPAATPVAARKKWIAGALEPTGSIIIDDGAITALGDGKSLLPAGVIGIEG